MYIYGWLTPNRYVQLMIDNVNITAALKKFRKQAIEKVEKTNDVNGLRVL